jgi:hypothetical protein
VRAPDVDQDRRAGLGDPARLAQGGDDVVGEEERREAGDEVERVVGIRQRLHVAVTQISIGQSRPCDDEQRLRRIDPVRAPTALCDEAQERPDATSDIEHAPARFEPDASERVLVVRDLLVLAQRPVRGPRAPQRAPALCTSGDGGRCHVRFLLDYKP